MIMGLSTIKEKELLQALKMARKYIAKIVADKLLTQCAIQPKRALIIIDNVIEDNK